MKRIAVMDPDDDNRSKGKTLTHSDVISFANTLLKSKKLSSEDRRQLEGLKLNLVSEEFSEETTKFFGHFLNNAEMMRTIMHQLSTYSQRTQRKSKPQSKKSILVTRQPKNKSRQTRPLKILKRIYLNRLNLAWNTEKATQKNLLPNNSPTTGTVVIFKQGGLMSKMVRVIETSNPPTTEELKRQNALVVHSLYEAAEIIAQQRLCNLVTGLNVPVMFLNPNTFKNEIDAAYYELVTKKPIFKIPPTETQDLKAEQLTLNF